MIEIRAFTASDRANLRELFGRAGEGRVVGHEEVHNEATASPERQVEPSLALGEQEGHEHLQFYRVRDISVASDGSLFILNAGNASLRVFDSAGVFLEALGTPAKARANSNGQPVSTCSAIR